MKFTAENFSKVFCDYMNNNPMGKCFMRNLQSEAVRQNFTQEQFDKAKIEFFKDVLGEMLKIHPELLKEFVEE
jgi:hypothetical protein